MAYNDGKVVRQGNTNKKLSTEKSPAAAKKRVRQLHKENNPLEKNRGSAAKSRYKNK